MLSVGANAQQRFPKPEFETGYEQPDTTTPEPRSLDMEYMDVGILTLVILLGAWFVLKKRSRKGLLWLSVFTVFYFGFYRNGCICSVGSIQNLALSLFNEGYSISYTVLAFFLIPLIASLLWGRIFCASACPLGAIQDLLIVKPISLPVWLRKTLGLIPYIYLGFAVLFAATGTDFIICRYDPFVGIFRMGASFHMLVIGISFLLIGMFVARPYCRFFCAYGVLLNWTSRFSSKHLSITPASCIQCKLCDDSCPFDAIDKPVVEKASSHAPENRRRFIIYALMIPLWMVLGGFLLSLSHHYLARANQDVYLAELLIEQPELRQDKNNIDVATFMASGKTMDALVEEAKVVRKRFYTGSWYLGAFLGLVIGMTLLNQVVFRKREDYQPNKGDCFSCGRCMDYCPVKKVSS